MMVVPIVGIAPKKHTSIFSHIYSNLNTCAHCTLRQETPCATLKGEPSSRSRELGLFEGQSILQHALQLFNISSHSDRSLSGFVRTSSARFEQLVLASLASSTSRYRHAALSLSLPAPKSRRRDGMILNDSLLRSRESLSLYPHFRHVDNYQKFSTGCIQ